MSLVNREMVALQTSSELTTASWRRTTQTLFLCSLFLYPFAVASHTLYLVPQAMILAIMVYRLASDLVRTSYERRKYDLVFLAIATLAPAIAGELAAAFPEYSEVGKLTLNLATVLVLLFSPKVFNLREIARWLPRFALLWLLLAIASYVRSGTTFVDLALLFTAGSAVSSSSLYSLAEPLSQLFLTKNIAAMYLVAVYGLFLYSARASSQKVRVWHHGIFLLAVLIFASRQGVLSMLAMVGLARFTSDISYKRKLTEGTIAASLGVVAFLMLFDLSSPNDGAYTRVGLWKHFMEYADTFLLTGDGLHGLNQSLAPLEIDNYHMFFMNQIGAYGILHCIAFNLFLFIIILRASPRRFVPLLVAPYWLNVCFQTYGYEYGNLFLMIVAANTFRSREGAASPAVVIKERPSASTA